MVSVTSAPRNCGQRSVTTPPARTQCSSADLRTLHLSWPVLDRISSRICPPRIAFGVLAEFTALMMTTYPPLSAMVSRQSERTWDYHQTAWASIDVTLPVTAGKRLLLVPTSWVWPRQLITAPSFYQVQALGRIQDRLTTPATTPGQRPIAPTKESLRAVHPDVRRTNIDQALDAVDDGISLMARHTEHVQNRFEEIKLGPDEINRLIS